MFCSFIWASTLSCGQVKISGKLVRGQVAKFHISTPLLVSVLNLLSWLYKKLGIKSLTMPT
jgi:hypothetical protein